MGKIYIESLSGRSFHSRQGKAYLFNDVVNISEGPKEERLMTTGLHEVADIHCKKCMQLCGWRYVMAHEENQKYKEGKFILERAKMMDLYEGNFTSASEASTVILGNDMEEVCS
ncbi:yippee-domain-containing protein [Coccomyxa subellipsoidea C-169]|uniref:Protein yippee-like n=1 Tax=Coccomyxa subellipsoidea (strain C-169) TaxID=574566 RepID=I0Z902_COCSC|nr:yippee-domain-containing protein [Coccomyxa subellipsoidea C-169]EIE27121.1 yippee-domain-containing protein [Coccomyxa subellipsoidea C-169]|eukprot:XP_005651665.1 yippee-domain-containing protein [Coccomyxa subellipsoidea C-169]